MFRKIYQHPYFPKSNLASHKAKQSSVSKKVEPMEFYVVGQMHIWQYNQQQNPPLSLKNFFKKELNVTSANTKYVLTSDSFEHEIYGADLSDPQWKEVKIPPHTIFNNCLLSKELYLSMPSSCIVINCKLPNSDQLLEYIGEPSCIKTQEEDLLLLVALKHKIKKIDEEYVDDLDSEPDNLVNHNNNVTVTQNSAILGSNSYNDDHDSGSSDSSSF